MKASFAKLSAGDFFQHPVWKFTNANKEDEMEVTVVAKPRGESPNGLIIAAPIRTADGEEFFALHQNVSLAGDCYNKHFLTITVAKGDEWFALARYHDAAFDTFGPEQLAHFLSKPVEKVFPIWFDLRPILGDSAGLCGTIDRNPEVTLDLEQLIKLASSNR